LKKESTLLHEKAEENELLGLSSALTGTVCHQSENHCKEFARPAVISEN
jgi:hypothetical protein